ncbi:hypothetical protein [Sphingomonas sp. Leaf25]|uniref:hypothetical protein n=1 Tax=Sphingomonas sp. Leaf25 TaxID=1735692 RepID=UPI000701A0AD|nr:hypothetical protein [Sphingomonas sp. Leaf25]KQM98736.1 hypothetical protein ASE78_05780 [Sphingomonas sp. Leaf25]
MTDLQKVSASDFLGLFAGQADTMPAALKTAQGWREHAEDLAAFMDGHEGCLPNNDAFMLMLRIGGMLLEMSEALAHAEAQP